MLGLGNSIVQMANWWMDRVDKKEQREAEEAAAEAAAAVELAAEKAAAEAAENMGILFDKINTEEPGSDYRVKLERHLIPIRLTYDCDNVSRPSWLVPDPTYDWQICLQCDLSARVRDGHTIPRSR